MTEIYSKELSEIHFGEVRLNYVVMRFLSRYISHCYHKRNLSREILYQSISLIMIEAYSKDCFGIRSCEESIN